MNNENMTAVMSLFAQAYHFNSRDVRVFDNPAAKKLLTPEEYRRIEYSVSQGAAFFGGMDTDGIVNGILAPTPLLRAAFAEDALHTAVKLGTMQYVILASGYDTFSLRRSDWAENTAVFEVDLPEAVADKRRRVKMSGLKAENTSYICSDLTEKAPLAPLKDCGEYDSGKLTFFSLLGFVYYVSDGCLDRIMSSVSEICPVGSTVVLDYPAEGYLSAQKQSKLAMAAGQPMKSEYSYEKMERLMEKNGFLIYEDIGKNEIESRFLTDYNTACPECKMYAQENVRFLLAVKHG